jgi:hypothetical protein
VEKMPIAKTLAKNRIAARWNCAEKAHIEGVLCS